MAQNYLVPSSSGPTTTGDIPALLRDGLNTVFIDYPLMKGQWKEFYTQTTADHQFEYVVEGKTLRPAAFKPQGGASLANDAIRQAYEYVVEMKTAMIVTQLTMEAVLNNKYASKFGDCGKYLKNSLAIFKEYQGAIIPGTGFDSDAIQPDGQPIYSTSHPVSGGFSANTFPVNVAMSEESLSQLAIMIQYMRDNAGNICEYEAKKLIVSPDNMFEAKRLLGSDYRPGTANNDLNALKAMNIYSEGFATNIYLPDKSMYFALTTAEEGFRYFGRLNPELDCSTDPYNNNLLLKAYEMFGMMCINWRGSAASRAM